MNPSSWGNYPKIKSKIFKFHKISKLTKLLDTHNNFIVYGNGRSYGDSALSKNIILSKYNNYFLNFDNSTGLLHLQSGVILSDILDIFVPMGWFLSVSPGTKFITVGGAIASDIHGKNHHLNGCFSESVKAFTLVMSSGDIVKCSREENFELFRATCGGMGLTGVIIDVELFLIRIESQNINLVTVKTSNLKETFSVFEEYANNEYIVAWLDCLESQKKSGKCLITIGNFKKDNDLAYEGPKKIMKLRFKLPSFFLNRPIIKIFNFLYFGKVRKKISSKTVNLASFFYPLDSIQDWNKLYGSNGFIQYQFVLPKKNSFLGLKEILNLILKSNCVPTLAVLKLFGPGNKNYLSFPIEGYTLAVDFKIENKLFKLLESIDEVILKNDGRIYLAKDARVSKKVFECGYPEIGKFRLLRRNYNLDKKFNSSQSKRLEI
jgi:decaprenylphospho-beta-D-ribofuranose 2-oxidase